MKPDDGVEVHPYVCGRQCYIRLVKARKIQKEADSKNTKKMGDKDSAPDEED